ncbi:phosphatase 2C-like domain-containing protein [Mucor mucedo]|uniref:phosphatase 2C-like domain-containing protein n=1 Tax=Mucor mucedo TaxID=29922 RepID=UPI00222033C0|nr:phosphatase 2C-like domain-containing protein [Mucor mucedo]KAI7892120.1 phosphatase 2C-like domain-containing protein [Mucor mucedo]
MEDAHTHILQYKETGAAFFAVFDGHGGANVAKYSSEKLFENVLDSDDFKEGQIENALRKGFFKIDSDLREGDDKRKKTRTLKCACINLRIIDPFFKNETSGCTAIVALLTKDNELYVSNAGDSRAIICTQGLAIALSEDHKPGNPKETERITNAGGHVEFGRVNGNLALSRALGDFEFKGAKHLPAEEQAVTADPDITVHKLTPKDEFMVLACDGIWDCLSNQQVATFVRKHVTEGVPLKEICERLMDSCLAKETGSGGIGCDNMTVEIVAFLNGQSSESWYEKIKSTEPVPKANVPLPSNPSSQGDEPTNKKQRGMQSESRQYSVNELQNAPDLTASLVDEEPKGEVKGGGA